MITLIVGDMFKAIIRNKVSYVIIGIYVVILVWWIQLSLNGHPKQEAFIFDWSYGFIGLIGALYSIFSVSKEFSGYKSILGRAFIFIPCGLLGQWIGLQIWTYYNVIAHIDLPYPSWADAGYFALVPAYTVGAIMLAQAAGIKFSLQELKGKLIAIIIPALMLALAYGLFIKNIGLDLSNPIKAFFDFGYPLGEIIPVSIAFITFLSARNLLGGKIKGRMFYLLFAFFFQFVTEYYFLYISGNGTVYNGSIADLMYATSYAIMSLGLISFKHYAEGNNTAGLVLDMAPKTRSIFNKLAEKIIQSQEEVMGAAALNEAKKIQGLHLNWSDHQVSFEGNEVETLTKLLEQYKNLFGPLAMKVCKEATRNIIKDLPQNQIPSLLKS
jgi:hypothetical protein